MKFNDDVSKEANNNSFNYNNIDEYINKNKTEKGSKKESHQMIKKEGRINFLVKDEEHNDFMNLLNKEKKNDKDNEINILEKSKELGPLYLDFDFKMITKKRLFDEEELKELCMNLKSVIVKHYNIENIDGITDILECYVLLKEKPLYNDEKKKYCDGIHIHYPNLYLLSIDRLLLYDLMIEKLKSNECMKKIIDNTGEELDKIFDKSVLFKDKWWFLYGCGKIINNNHNIYKLKYIFTSDNVFENNIDINEKKIRKKLSIRKLIDDTQTIKIKDTYKSLLSQKNENKFFVENQKSNEKIIIQVSNNNESTNFSNNQKNLTTLESAIELTKMLSVERATAYETWRDVGYALYNISTELKNTFHEFSSLCVEKYKYEDVENFWRNCNIKTNSNYIYGLEQWAKNDNRELFSKYLTNKLHSSFHKNIDIKADYDLATIIHSFYKNEYVCSSLKKGEVWWQFKNHKWIQIDNAASLSVKMSEEFAYQLSNLSSIINNKGIELQNKGEHLESDRLLKKSQDIIGLIRKFKTQSFKKKIIAETANIFYTKNPNFVDKLDENKYLIGFNNGVYDLESMIFRSGKPDDYLTFSTGYDYTEFNPNDAEFKKKEKIIDDFFESIQPDEDKRKFLLLYLSSILKGGNTDQLALIFTGKGANGKGTLTYLMKKALGDYYSTADATLITKQRGNAGNASPHLADKKGKRWLELEEPEADDKIETGMLKIITGENVIQARELYGNIFYYQPQFKFTLQCNDKPSLKTNDGGVKRRIRVLYFPIQFVPKPKKKNERKINIGLENKLEECKDVFIWKLINVEYRKYNKLKTLKGNEPESVMEDSAEYIDSSNTLKIFFDTKYEFTDERKNCIMIEDLWNEYQDWHKQNYPSVKNINQPKMIEFLKNQDILLNKTLTKAYKLKKKDSSTEEDLD